MHDVLREMGVGSGGEIHIASVTVDSSDASWVHGIYNEVLDQAVRQGILPFNMYVTEDKNAAKFLLESLNKIS